jgi:uncharacterized protein involved in exopolysaccharide biosynthesis
MPEARPLPRDHLDSLVKLGRRALRFWWIALVTGAIGAAVTAGVTRMRRPQFLSQAVVYYQEGIQWNFSGAEGVASTRRVGQRLKETLLARSRLQKIVEELRVYPHLLATDKVADAVEDLHAAVSFKVNEGDTFTITFTGDSPAEAQRVTAKLVETLIGENTRLRAEQAEIAMGFLDAEKKRNEENLHLKETELAQFLAKHPEFAQEQQGTTGAAIRATTKKGAEPAAPSVVSGDPNLLALTREEERLRHQLAAPGTMRATQDPALLAAKSDAEAKLNAARKDLADKRARFTEQHPDVRAAAAQVDHAEEAYNRAVEALKVPASEVLEIEPRAALQARLAQVQEEIRDYQKKKGKPTAREEGSEAVSTNDVAQRIVALETTYARLNREVEDARERFQQLDSKEFLASMAASSLTNGQAAQITVIDPANLPAQAVGLSSKKLLLFGIMASFGLGVVVALLFGIIDDRVYDRLDVERLELAPVLIEVPRFAVTRKVRRSGG